jgi:protein tyrosine/serine phosphatase
MAPSSHITVAQLLKLAETDVRITIPEADTTTILSTPPFLTVSGTFNMRDIGRVSGSPMRPNYAFRSGLLENLETNDFTTLAQKYGIKWIFDLRSEEEQTRSPDPDIIGIKNVWLPTTPDDSVDVSNFITGGGEEGYRKMYMDVMETHSRVFKALLKHVRDRAEEPFLIHCTRE